jgi:hypothetical protein
LRSDVTGEQDWAKETQKIEARVSARFQPALREGHELPIPATRSLIMKRYQWQNRIGTATLAFSLLFAAAIMLSTTAQAQYPQTQYPNDRDSQQRRDRDNGDRNNGSRKRHGGTWDGYANYGGSFQLRQTALNAGYNDGNKQGRSDRNKRNRSNYRDNSSYRKATKDYSSRLGDRELYQRYYRDAYPNGYDDGLGGN